MKLEKPSLDRVVGTGVVATRSWPPLGTRLYGVDLDKLAASYRALLDEQAEVYGRVFDPKADTLTVADNDQTLMLSRTPLLLLDMQTGRPLMNPDKPGEVLVLGVGECASPWEELEQVRQRHPEIPWGRYAQSLPDSFNELMNSPPIDGSIRDLRRADRTPNERDYVVTGRDDARQVVPAVREYLRLRGIEIDGVIVVRDPVQTKQLGTEEATRTQPTAAMKTLLTAGLIRMHGPGVKELAFYDDSDKTLREAMKVLPKLFGDVNFKFYDTVHVGDHKFRNNLIASGRGELHDEQGKPFGADRIDAYKSPDAPFPKLDAFEPQCKPGGELVRIASGG